MFRKDVDVRIGRLNVSLHRISGMRGNGWQQDEDNECQSAEPFIFNTVHLLKDLSVPFQALKCLYKSL